MKPTETKTEGISLIIGCILMIVTMVLHPVGGDFHHLLRIASIGIIAHSIAIFSIPFVIYGFWGLTQKLDTSISRLSFVFMAFGLVAVMIAAAINGLILMDFVKTYDDASEETITTLKPFFRLIRSANHAFDFIFMGAVYTSTLLWSISILKTKALPAMLGWFGILITLIGLGFLLAGFVFVDVHGFRIFIFGWVAWVIWCGWKLTKKES